MKKYLGVIILALMLPVSASATLVLTPGGEATSGPETAQPLIDDAVAAFLGISVAEWTGSELYKENVEDGFDTGSAAGWYTTTFLNDPLDPKDADIVWGGGDYIADPGYLLVKDGNHDPGWYLFDISSWDGMMDIQLRDFWPAQGAISHVTLYSGGEGECCDREVPEPGPIGLLGFGVVALYVARRRRLQS